MPNIDLSVIIVTHNSQPFIKRCIDLFIHRGLSLASEIIVVDNFSQDATVDLIKKDFPNVKLIQNTSNLGFAKAANQGIRQARGRYIFLLNPDTELFEGSLEKMIEYMDGNSRCGILGPKLLDPDGKTQLSCRSFPSHSTALFNRYSLLTRIFPRSKYADRYLKTTWQHNIICDVDWVSGAAMVIKKECLEDIGDFDEGFFMYCEDVDICKRARDKNWRVIYYPPVRIIHFMGGSIKYVPRSAVIWHHRSMWYYYKKYFKVNTLWNMLVFIFIFMRAAFFLVFSRTR